ncbi:MAG: deaminase [Planctomycetota bacterium]
MLLGVTGRNGSGKDTLADHLAAKGFAHLSLSDVIREEARRRKLAASRANLVRIGNELRSKFGPGVLAERTLARIAPDRNYVITSIRNPGEVETLVRSGRFVLVAVDAPAAVRFARLVRRARAGDARLTFREFVRQERREESNDPAGLQLHNVVAMARFVLPNGGTIEALHARADAILPKAAKLATAPRPGWDEYFLRIARVVSTRSNCMKRKVAAVIVKDRRIISTGYNGTPRGTRNCDEGGCPRCNSFAGSGTRLEECTCSHGEENAIVQAAYHGVSLKNGIIYTTFSPCLLCAKMIINAGITEVIYNADYPLAKIARGLLQEAGVKVRRCAIDGE